MPKKHVCNIFILKSWLLIICLKPIYQLPQHESSGQPPVQKPKKENLDSEERDENYAVRAEGHKAFPKGRE